MYDTAWLVSHAMTLVTERKQMEPEAALRRVLFLKTIPEKAMEALISAGEPWELQKGDSLFEEFSRCRGLMVVLQGVVKVYKLDSRGDRKSVV